jgi:serine/threonine protein kinase
LSSELRSELLTLHPNIADELRDAVRTLRKLQQITGPGTAEDAGIPKLPVAPPDGAAAQGNLEATLVGKTTEGDVEATFVPAADATPAADAVPAARPNLAAGDSFGRYQVVRQLGKGAMGAVYLAYDGQLERHVALKIPFFGDNPETVRRFYREARSTAKIRSPNVCPVFDVGQVGGVHFISMAFIEGEPLSIPIDERRLKDPRDIAEVVQKIARGLQKAHDLGVIHRDLKPDNIMVDCSDGEPIVMDFGLARQVDEESQATKAGTLLGTPAYMSPEQVAGDQSQLTPATDIYSLGVVLYKALTGRLPFEGSIIQIIGKIAHEAPPPPSSLCDDIEAGAPLEVICLKMMAKDPKDRFPRMTDVEEAFEDFLHQDLVAPESPGIWSRIWRAVFGASG